MPIGAFASVAGDTMTINCIVVSPDGARAARAEVSGPSGRAANIGAEAAERLLAAGADQILDALR
jgi:hydroxymethylbilane synthase